MKKIIYIISVIFGLCFYSCSEEYAVQGPAEDDSAGGTGDVTEEDNGINIDFTEEALRLDNKRGLSLTEAQRQLIQNIQEISLENFGWLYNLCDNDIWHLTGVECVHVADLAIDEAGLNRLSKLVKEGTCERILCSDVPYSEQDIESSVNNAINTWTNLQKLKVPLGSPTIDLTKEEDPWFEAFMNKINELQYRVDYLCVKYLGSDIEDLKLKIQALNTKYQLPILVTGFAVVDSDATSTEENEYSAEDVMDFMKSSMEWMDDQEYIYGYAWTSFDIDEAIGCTSALFDTEGLTELGEYYVMNEKEPEYGPNLVPIPGFEEDNISDFWTWTDGLKIVDDSNGEVISGLKTCRMEKSNNKIMLKNSINITSGKRYKFGFTGRVQTKAGPEGTGNTIAYVRLALYDENGNSLKITTGDIKSNMNTTVTSEAILNVSKVKVGVYTGLSQQCYVYIDDIFLMEVN